MPRYLIIDSGVLVIAEPDVKGNAKNVSPGVGVVTNSIPLQNIAVGRPVLASLHLQLEVDKSDESILHVTSHVTTSQFAFQFEDSTQCQTAQQRLEKAKNNVRAMKMRHIDELLTP